MSTKQHSENMFIFWWLCQLKNIFKQFVKLYENLLHNKVEKENKAYFESFKL